MCTPAGKFDTVTIPANYQEPQRNINPESWDVFYFRFLLTRLPTQSRGVLWRREPQRLHGLELCPAVQVLSTEYWLSPVICGQTLNSANYRNGRLELLAMHHGPLMRVMEKLRAHSGLQRPWLVRELTSRARLPANMIFILFNNPCRLPSSLSIKRLNLQISFLFVSSSAMRTFLCTISVHYANTWFSHFPLLEYLP